MASFHHRAFGLRIDSDAPISGLPETTAEVPGELGIHMGTLPDAFDPTDPAIRELWHSESDRSDDVDAVTLSASADSEWLILQYADGTRFVLDRGGTGIWATWPARESADSAATYLLGPVIGFVLRLRGLTCFHASSVVIADRVILMLGPAGSGKSSIAAALALRGHRVTGDDIAVVQPDGGRWLVLPSIPGVRLWDDMVETLLGRSDALPLLAPGWEKRQLDLRTAPAGFRSDVAVPLGAIYVLSQPDPSGTLVSERLRPRDAFLSLVANTYANVLLTPALRRAEFDALSAIVQTVPVWRVGVPDKGRGFDQFCARVEAADAASDFGPGAPDG